MSEHGPATRHADLTVGCTTPILRVADLDASLAYYADALGWVPQPDGGWQRAD